MNSEYNFAVIVDWRWEDRLSLAKIPSGGKTSLMHELRVRLCSSCRLEEA
jgi:hypothetical protein